MNYSLFKLTFTSGVHFGTGNLDSTETVFRSDSLFSALFVEALKSGDETADRFKNLVESGRLSFSDALPYKGTNYFLPKPCIYIDHKTDDTQNSSILKKQSKKLKYISVDNYLDFFTGELDVQAQLELTEDLGVVSLRTSAVIDREEGTVPYQVGVYRFQPGCGLYIIVGYEADQDLKFIEELLNGLSYSGLGGRRSAGLGSFTMTKEDIPNSFNDLLYDDKDISVLLSTAYPKDEELDSCLIDAEYMVIKRGGFIGSYNEYLNNIRKRDVYMFAAGSCFKHRFSGRIMNVSRDDAHTVYRSAVPMWIGVDI